MLLLLYFFYTTAAFTPASTWTTEELARANTANNASYLTKEEKKTIMLVNLARLDGKRYLQTYFQEYKRTPYLEMESSANKYLVSLKADMDKVKNLTMLMPNEGLSKSASHHAKDSGKNGIIGHTSSNGTSFGKRLPKYIKDWSSIAENCSYGYNEAAKIVGQLLLDEDVPSLGHRKTILNAKLEYIGVAIAPHSKYQYTCVMDFCAKFDD